MVRDDHRLFFQDVSFEGNVPVMVVHLPFQFLSWRGNGAESREVASARPEAEPVDVRMIRLSQEKEIPGMADGGQDIHVVEISFFRNLTERGAKGLQVDAYRLADGIFGHGYEGNDDMDKFLGEVMKKKHTLLANGNFLQYPVNRESVSFTGTVKETGEPFFFRIYDRELFLHLLYILRSIKREKAKI